LAKALIVFHILGIIGRGVTRLCALVTIYFAKSQMLFHINTSFSISGAASLLERSIAVTVLDKLVAGVVNMIGHV